MPIKLRYNKQDFLVSDGVKTLEDLLVQLANTPLKDVCPKHFYIFYFDEEGDKIVISSTEDLLSFVEYCSTNSMNMVVSLKPCEAGKGALQLKQAKPINEVVQEELQKQLEASVMRLRQEMTETVKQLVEEQTKDFQLTQSIIKPKIQTEGIPSFFEVLQEHIQTFQNEQDSLLASNQDYSNVNVVFDNLADCIKDITLVMKNHVQNLKKEVKSRREQQALHTQEKQKQKEEKAKKAEEKARKEEEKLKKEKKKDQKEKEKCKEQEKKGQKDKDEKKEKKEKKTLVDVIQTQPAPLVQSEIKEAPKEAPKEAVNQPQELIVQAPQPLPSVSQEPAQNSQVISQPQQQPVQQNQPQMVENIQATLSRARDLSQLFGFEQSVVYALIVQNPQQTDDEIMNQLLDQFK